MTGTGSKPSLWKRVLTLALGSVLALFVVCAITIYAAHQWLAKEMANEWLADYQSRITKLSFQADSWQSLTIHRLELELQGNPIILEGVSLHLPKPIYAISIADIGQAKLNIETLTASLQTLPHAWYSALTPSPTNAKPDSQQELGSELQLPQIQLTQGKLNLFDIPLTLTDLVLIPPAPEFEASDSETSISKAPALQTSGVKANRTDSKPASNESHQGQLPSLPLPDMTISAKLALGKTGKGEVSRQTSQPELLLQLNIHKTPEQISATAELELQAWQRLIRQLADNPLLVKLLQSALDAAAINPFSNDTIARPKGLLSIFNLSNAELSGRLTLEASLDTGLAAHPARGPETLHAVKSQTKPHDGIEFDSEISHQAGAANINASFEQLALSLPLMSPLADNSPIQLTSDSLSLTAALPAQGLFHQTNLSSKNARRTVTLAAGSLTLNSPVPLPQLADSLLLSADSQLPAINAQQYSVSELTSALGLVFELDTREHSEAYTANRPDKGSALELDWSAPVTVKMHKGVPTGQQATAQAYAKSQRTALQVSSPGKFRFSLGPQQLSLAKPTLSCVAGSQSPGQNCSLKSDYRLTLNSKGVHWPISTITNATTNQQPRDIKHSIKTGTGELTASGSLDAAFSIGSHQSTGTNEVKTTESKSTPEPATAFINLATDLTASSAWVSVDKQLTLSKPALTFKTQLGVAGDKLSLNRPQLTLSLPEFEWGDNNIKLLSGGQVELQASQWASWLPLNKQPNQALAVHLKLDHSGLLIADTNPEGKTKSSPQPDFEHWQIPAISLMQQLNWHGSKANKSAELRSTERWMLGAVSLSSQHQLTQALPPPKPSTQQPTPTHWLLQGQWRTQTLMPTLEELAANSLPPNLWHQLRPRDLSVSGLADIKAEPKITFAVEQAQLSVKSWQLALTPEISISLGQWQQMLLSGGKLSGHCQASSRALDLDCQDVNITLKEFNPGLPIEQVQLAGTATPTQGQFNIQGRGELLGGEFLLPEFVFDPHGTSSAYLVLQGLSLPDLLALQPLEGVTATGIFDGVLPAKIKQGKVSVSGGRLAARAPGGLIAVTDNPTVVSLRQSQPHLDFAFNALEHLQYSTLASTFDMQASGEARLKVQIKGRTPGITRPIEFNYNHQENLLQLLQSLQIGNTLQQQLQDSLE